MTRPEFKSIMGHTWKGAVLYKERAPVPSHLRPVYGVRSARLWQAYRKWQARQNNPLIAYIDLETKGLSHDSNG